MKKRNFEFPDFCYVSSKELADEVAKLHSNLEYGTIDPRDVLSNGVDRVSENGFYSDDISDAITYAQRYVAMKEYRLLPERVAFIDEQETTVVIDDDKVTVVRTMEGDKYDREFGFLMAYFQHYSGLSKTQAKKYIKEVIE